MMNQEKDWQAQGDSALCKIYYSYLITLDTITISKGTQNVFWMDSYFRTNWFNEIDEVVGSLYLSHSSAYPFFSNKKVIPKLWTWRRKRWSDLGQHISFSYFFYFLIDSYGNLRKLGSIVLDTIKLICTLTYNPVIT